MTQESGSCGRAGGRQEIFLQSLSFFPNDSWPISNMNLCWCPTAPNTPQHPPNPVQFIHISLSEHTAPAVYLSGRTESSQFHNIKLISSHSFLLPAETHRAGDARGIGAAGSDWGNGKYFTRLLIFIYMELLFTLVNV